MELIVELKCPRCGQIVTSFESFRDPEDPGYLRDVCAPCDDEMASDDEDAAWRYTESLDDEETV